MFRRFRPYFKYLSAVRGHIAKAVIYGVLYGLSSGAGIPLLIKFVFPPIFDRHDGAMPISTVMLIAACIPMVFLLRAVTGFLNSYYTQYAGVLILESIRLDYFKKLQLLPLSFVQRRQTGDLISRGLADTAQLQFTLTQIANDGIKQPAQLIGSIGAVILLAFTSQGVTLILVCLAAVPLVVLPIRYVGKKVIKRAADLQSRLGQVTSHFSENLAAAREVRAFGLEQHETKRFAAGTTALVVAQMKITKYAQALTPAIELISSVGIAFTLVYAYGSGVDLATFISLILALYTSYEPVKKIGALNSEMKRGEASLDRLEIVLHEPVTIADPAQPVEVGRLRGDLAFEHVTFGYDGNVALQDVSIRIPAGTVCALVGPSGAGKTTFANLVPRFYEAGEGRVTVDGLGIRDLRLADLRRNIALVSQEPVLFNDTIYNNLLLGRPGATRDEVVAAAKSAHAHEFITAFTDGYETSVGERGGRLSGGQKQRIAIARAFLRNAPILILDEATSALDSDAEAKVQDALRHLVVGKTVLIIAHRFSTIRDATMILVFDRGRVTASGTHAELYAGNALYKSLYDRQLGES